MKRDEPRYERSDDCAAFLEPVPTDATILARVGLDDGVVTICSCDSHTDGIQPWAVVYRLGGTGPPAVPSGRVLVRFNEECMLESQHQVINDAGYEIDQPLVYAPHAGWLRARDGSKAAALAGIGRLEAIPGIENVEPQLILEASRRAGA